ncbi:MAG: BREX-1 system adenine-specific DNA-methyltransferase PglX [Ardenticatenaceae bacterium]|nr:BREX-1 system adenine-specific DNA-methyltransferase PglX [Ardenticatenaceae bacterium]
MSETGVPAGHFPLIADYDVLPDPPDDLDLSLLPWAVPDILARHARINPTAEELAHIRVSLQALYEAGPGANGDNLDLEELDHYADEEENASGAHIPIPTETFLEELSVKLQIHPISVYRLLEELRAEGVRCKPEERRLLEDRLSVLVLRLLGHRWPKQIEAGEPVPAWADRDGVIPLMPGSGETTVAERLRERLRAGEGALGVQRTEALLHELTGRTVDEWLRRDFFPRHMRQFKYRPIAWHLASRPETPS